MNAARVENFVESICDSLLKSVTFPIRRKIGQKRDIVCIHCNFLSKEEVQFSREHTVQHCFFCDFLLEKHTDPQETRGGASKKLNVDKKTLQFRQSF